MAVAVAAVLTSISCSPETTVTATNVVSQLLLEADRTVVQSSGGDVDLKATVRTTTDDPADGVEVQFLTTGGEFVGGDSVTTNDDGVARTTLHTAVEATVTARALPVESNEVTIRIDLPVDLTISLGSEDPQAGQTVEFSVRGEPVEEAAGEGEKVLEGEPVTGELEVRFGDGNSELVPDFSEDAVVEHVYQEAGEYTVEAILTEDNGNTTRTERLTEIMPEPPPEEPDDPDDPITGADEINLQAAEIGPKSARDVASWKITSELYRVEINRQICLYHTKAGKWPVKNATPNGQATEGNPWIFVKLEGGWYGVTYEWLRPGQICKLGNGKYGSLEEELFHHFDSPKAGKLQGWRPQSGEKVGFMVSALARFDARSVRERTQVVVITWP